MGAQNSPATKPEKPALLSVPECGYRVVNLQESINEGCSKLNIMTDYVIGQDPRLIDLQYVFEQSQSQLQFEVFSILDYKIRKVKLEVNQNIGQRQGQDKVRQVQLRQSGDALQEPSFISSNMDSQFARRQYTVGVSFRYYPKICDSILRISKMFKDSPLQLANIKKDEYIVGVMQGQFTSMKQFVELIKFLIQSNFQFITLGICSSQGKTRLQRIPVKDLQNWKRCYGVGYLGVQLAEGWLNKWQLKKNIEANKKKQTNSKHDSIQTQNILSKSELLLKQQVQNQTSKTNNQTVQKNQLNNNKQELKQEVDLFKQYPKNKKEQELQDTKNKLQNSKQKIQQAKDPYKYIKQQKPSIKEQKLNKYDHQVNQQQMLQQSSQISSEQIQRKCSQLQYNYHQGKVKDMNLVKRSKNIIQINFKGILKNQYIDDASTICLCKEYSKHCEKCFKEKEGNYYFFNKKTNKIILIQKSMLFPKKN